MPSALTKEAVIISRNKTRSLTRVKWKNGLISMDFV